MKYNGAKWRRNELSYLKDKGGYREESTVHIAKNVTNPKPDHREG
jgi:hypothetical protein